MIIAASFPHINMLLTEFLYLQKLPCGWQHGLLFQLLLLSQLLLSPSNMLVAIFLHLHVFYSLWLELAPVQLLGVLLMYTPDASVEDFCVVMFKVPPSAIVGRNCGPPSPQVAYMGRSHTWAGGSM
jgi:hypothetical protein